MLILVDTSVWINHLRTESLTLLQLLDQDVVLCHPLVIGELACGNLKHRSEVLESLTMLPASPIIEHDELLMFVYRHPQTFRARLRMDRCASPCFGSTGASDAVDP